MFFAMEAALEVNKAAPAIRRFEFETACSFISTVWPSILVIEEL